MKAKITVTLKTGVHDPQGEAVKGALSHMGFHNIADVRVGKYIEIDLTDFSAGEAKSEVGLMCKKLLANPVIESYRFEIT